MSIEKNGGAAFPGSFAGHCGNPDHMDPCGCYLDQGMSLRDWFAGQALAGILAGNQFGCIQDISDLAYKRADEMLKTRTK